MSLTFSHGTIRISRLAVAAVATLWTLPTALAGETELRDELTVSLAKGHNAITAAVRAGADRRGVKITVALDDGTQHVLGMRAGPQHVRTRIRRDGKHVWTQRTMPDAAIRVTPLVTWYSRPRLQRYTTAQQAELIGRWETLPAASTRFLVFEARQVDGGVAFYLAGQYVGRRDGAGKLRSVTFVWAPGGAARDGRSLARPRDERYLPLETRFVARPGVMKAASVSPAPGRRSVRGVPMVVADAAASVDVGVVKECKGSWALECDEHLSRTALDGMPETAHWSVPAAPYTRAWVLCAVDDDRSREAVLTARLTRFARSGRGGAIADTTIALPRGQAAPPSGVTKVGTVRYAKGGRTVTAPLLLAEVRLKLGEILDLLAMTEDPHASMTRQPYLDFELLGKLGGLSAQWDRRHKPDRKSTSAVHVFGVTLERSPVSVRVAPDQPGNIFHNDQKPETTVVVTATRAGGAALRWRIRDVRGKTVREAGHDLRFDARGSQQRITIPLKAPALGWYALDLGVRDERRREVLDHHAAFALLGTDTRRAGYDSPYGTWWFAGAHYGAGDKAIAGPMLFKAGLRKTTFGWCKYSEADMAPWKITLNQLGWRLAPKNLANPKQAYDDAAAKVRETLARFPHCRSADIFHESYAHYVPAELLGEKPAEDAQAVEAARARVKLATFAAGFYRERFPDIKLLVGNTSSSCSIIASLLRHGFDAKYIDYIGVEAVGQTGMPELLWEGSTQGIWLAREVARKFARDLPVTGCYEFTARADRNLGPRRQAEWIVRDMLLCHAYGFEHINPAILHDAGNSYVNTLWGAGGLCQRNPLLYPKPAYVGVATLTKVLDQVSRPRRVATGSTTVYALAFARRDGRSACALWTCRGQARLRMRYSPGAKLTRVGFYGASERLSPAAGTGEVFVTCGPAPVYVVSPAAVRSIEIASRELAGAPVSFRPAERMDRVARWRIEPGDDRLRSPTRRGLPRRVPGAFELTGVRDETKGPCLQLKLLRTGKVPDVVGEYTALRLREPLAVPGRPTDVGLWVRGDSGWGKIIFEVSDATGAVWRTDGVWHDWPGDLAVCHDGWRFLQFPLDGNSSARNVSPGRRWTSTSPKRKSTIQFPIKLTGLIVVMRRKALDLTEMKDTPGTLRFAELGTCGR